MHVHHALPAWFRLLVIGAVLGEIAWYGLVQKRAYPWRDMLVSLSISAMRLPVRALTPLVVLPIAFFLYDHRLATIPLDSVWGWGLLLLAEEFAYYWMHRSGHEIRWMWASHVVHHTPEHIHLASAFRIGVTEFLSGTWLFFLPLSWLGFNPLAVSAMVAISLFYQFWLHNDLIGRLGPIEWVFNTPTHHRVHHASNPDYLDRNYGGILIIWDRLFGTFAAEQPGTRIVYGLVHPVTTRNPLTLAFHEWRAMGRDVMQARSWRARVVALLGRPGAVAPTHPALPPVAAE